MPLISQFNIDFIPFNSKQFLEISFKIKKFRFNFITTVIQIAFFSYCYVNLSFLKLSKFSEELLNLNV